MQNRQRGFTMVEIAVVIAIIAILAILVIPSFGGAKDQASVNRQAQLLSGDLTKCRVMAGNGETNAAWGANDRARSAGVRIVTNAQYQLFIDRDGQTNGDEVTVKTVNIPTGMVIQSPAAGFTVRFKSNGTVSPPAQTDIELKDTNNNYSRVVRVSAAGLSKVL